MKKVICIKDCQLLVNGPVIEVGTVLTVTRGGEGFHPADLQLMKLYDFLERPAPPPFGYDASHFRDIEPMDVDALLSTIVKPELEPCV